MGKEMSEVFKERFPTTVVRTTPPEEREKILAALSRDLKLAQRECERTGPVIVLRH